MSMNLKTSVAITTATTGSNIMSPSSIMTIQDLYKKKLQEASEEPYYRKFGGNVYGSKGFKAN